VRSQIYSYDHLDLPALQQIRDPRGVNMHFLVPLGNKAWFEETGIPTSQVAELDRWDEITLPAQPGSDQKLKFVCTPALSFSLGPGRRRMRGCFHSRTRVYGRLDDTLG